MAEGQICLSRLDGFVGAQGFHVKQSDCRHDVALGHLGLQGGHVDAGFGRPPPLDQTQAENVLDDARPRVIDLEGSGDSPRNPERGDGTLWKSERR